MPLYEVSEARAEKAWRDAYPDGGAEEAWRHGLREWSLNLAEFTRAVWEYGHREGWDAQEERYRALVEAAEGVEGVIGAFKHHWDPLPGARATFDAFFTALDAVRGTE